MRSLRRLAPYLVLLFGFAVRLVSLDTTLIDGDRANPHGIGLLLAHQLAHGELTQSLLFSDNSSVGLPNPPLMNYVWAAVSLVDSSLVTAVALGLMANLVVVALVYVAGRRAFGWTAGLIAAMLAAGSNWAVYLARGTWHPAHLEILGVLAACVLASSLQQSHLRRLFAGFGLAMLAGAGYFAGLFVLIQAALASAFGGAWRMRLRQAWLAGVGVCLAGVLAFILAMVFTGRLTPVSAGRISLLQTSASASSTVDPSTRDPFGHFLRLATNRDYALSWTNRAYALYDVREPLSQALAVLLSISVAIGLGRMAWGSRQALNRFWLAWAGLPIAALLAVMLIKRDFDVAPYYLLLASPVPYLAGGYGLASMLGFVGARTRPLVTVALCGVLALVSAWNFWAAAISMRAQPFIIYDFMPLRWSMRLGRLWQRECTTLNGGNLWWDLSLFESPGRWRLNGTHSDGTSSIWTFAPSGGTCALKQFGAPLPNSDLLPLALEDGSVIRTYRARPFRMPQQVTMTVNLGWSLLDFDAPLEATVGTTVTVNHAWLVNAWPSEPHTDWYFAPFIKLVAPDGHVVVDLNGVALPGWQWQLGEVQASAIELALPASLPPGDYTLQSSLFDPNQKKNAVYFASSAPDNPVLTLTRPIRLARSPLAP